MNTCEVLNGKVKVGDIVTISSYGNEERYLYRITGFGEYNRRPQVYYRKIVPQTLDYFPDTSGSWMDLHEARGEMMIVYRKSLFGKDKRF